MSQQFGIGDVVKFRAGKGIAYGKIISQHGEKFVIENLRTQKTQNKGWDTLTLSSMEEFESTMQTVKPTAKSKRSGTVNKGKVWGGYKIGQLVQLHNGRCGTIVAFDQYTNAYCIQFTAGGFAAVSKEHISIAL